MIWRERDRSAKITNGVKKTNNNNLKKIAKQKGIFTKNKIKQIKTNQNQKSLEERLLTLGYTPGETHNIAVCS